MNWWRRLVRYLARHELAQVDLLRAELCKLAIDHTLKSQADEAFAFAKGVRHGAEQAFDAVERSVAERTGGVPDFVSPEDLARAKRGLLH